MCVFFGYQNERFANEHFQSQLWRATPSLHNGSRAPLHYVGRLEHWKDDLTELLNVVVAKDPEYYEQVEQRMKLALFTHYLFAKPSNHRGLSDEVTEKIIEPIPSLQKR